MKIDFGKLCEGISGINALGNRFGYAVDGVSVWYLKEEYCEFVGDERNDDGVTFTVNGVQYVEHWFFVNELHNSAVVGYSLLSQDGSGDMLFCVCGAKRDFVCDYDTMIEYLTDSKYFVD